jgi:MoxR-like ATPase
MMRISIGYPPREAEMQILKGGSRRKEIYSLDPVLTEDEVLDIQQIIRKDIYVSDRVLDYLLNIIEATRIGKYFLAGLSTRGALALVQTAKANAYFKGKDFVVPENIKEVAEYVIPHRVIFREEYENSNRKEIIKSLLKEIPVPV